jgi:hypothetical protein
VLNHVIHANAIATSGVWRIAQLSSTEVGVTSFWVLNFMWLKFLVIWRFFRSWALLDGVETPENISRCVYTGASGSHANLCVVIMSSCFQFMVVFPGMVLVTHGSMCRAVRACKAGFRPRVSNSPLPFLRRPASLPPANDPSTFRLVLFDLEGEHLQDYVSSGSRPRTRPH